ncbi:MAG TPA: magnesium chelatase domain-containing protein, partial [Tepiditoga sp.]|nr:magnesium chelatase domain-containing protein [Tepiditoga sp.]
HVPEGAVPKDGPSAGVTLTTAVFSCITGKEVKNSVSMTGEITLKGHVLPVGGIKEKILSAYRSGITEIILPYENQKDYDKIPQEVKDKINVHFVKDIKEVLSIALKGGINFENN